MRDTAVIACSNQKGGVGKTTTSVHLGAAFAERGLRALVWDLDPTHGATSHLGAAPNLAGTYEVLVGEVEPSQVILAEGAGLPPGLALLPSSRALERLDRELASRDGYTPPWECLRRPLTWLRSHATYDVVLLDTGPNANTPMRAAYAAADAFLAVVRPDRPSVEGLSSVLADIAQVRRPNLNPGLRFLGAVLNTVDRRTDFGRHYAASYEEFFAARGLAGALFPTRIPASVAFAKAWQARQTLFAYDPGHPALGPWRALAAEVLDRLHGAPGAWQEPPPSSAVAEAERYVTAVGRRR